MSCGLKNPLLAQAHLEIEAGLTGAVLEQYQVVARGFRAAVNAGPDGGMAAFRQSQDPVGDAARGAFALCLMASEHTPALLLNVGMRAAVAMMLRSLDFIESSGIARIGINELVRAKDLFEGMLFNCLAVGVGPVQTGTARTSDRVH